MNNGNVSQSYHNNHQQTKLDEKIWRTLGYLISIYSKMNRLNSNTVYSNIILIGISM